MRLGDHGAAVLAGAFGVAYSLRFVHDTFFGDRPRGSTASRTSRRAG
jgi:multicomponent K+:H+ antiporter subunit A